MPDLDLSPQVLARVRDAVDMLEIVGEHVRLKRRGRSWLGLCPFHDEKTPSFTVDPTKGLFYCFGCHAGGDAIDFLQRLERLSFPEAVERLARRFGVELPAASPEARQRHAEVDRLRAVLEEAQAWFQRQLRSPAGARARHELERRGFAEATWADTGFGFAPDEWRALLDVLAPRHPEGVLVRAGLAVQPEAGGRCYDRFRGRLMFPIRTADGRLVAFGGRILGDGEPKYLNSPEGALFSKRSTLFALDRARRAIADGGEVVVVEGYFDCLSAQRIGLHHVVATLGTALTTEHARVLRRLAERVVLCYDGDAAGRRAAGAGAAVLLQAGLEVKVAPLPAGEDPDDLVRSGRGDELCRLLAAPATLLDFLLADLPGERDARRKAGLEVGRLVATARDPVTRFGLLEELARRLDLPLEVLREQTGGGAAPLPRLTVSSGPSPGEEQLLRILLAGGARWRRALLGRLDSDALAHAGVRRLVEVARQLSPPILNDDDAFGRALREADVDPAARELVVRLCVEEGRELDEREIRVQIERLLVRQARDEARRLGPEIAAAEAAADTQRLHQLLRRKMELEATRPCLDDDDVSIAAAEPHDP